MFLGLHEDTAAYISLLHLHVSPSWRISSISLHPHCDIKVIRNWPFICVIHIMEPALIKYYVQRQKTKIRNIKITIIQLNTKSIWKSDLIQEIFSKIIHKGFGICPQFSTCWRDFVELWRLADNFLCVNVALGILSHDFLHFRLFPC